MQTTLTESIRATPAGAQAESILRKCVHCGFCLATCPTYELLGDELDSPRGRIYLIKQVLEGAAPSARTQLHLDRCLTCRACETTCPSGVEYGRLLDIGREITEAQVERNLPSRVVRKALRTVLLTPNIFGSLLALARMARPLLPVKLRSQVPLRAVARTWPHPRHARKMLVLDGCVQPVLNPGINAAAAQVLDRLGISLIRAPRAGCCGALSHHMTASDEARALARRNIDAWWPHIESGAEAVVATASGCGAMIAEYGDLLRADRGYAEKAAKVSALFRDISVVIAAERVHIEALAPAWAASARMPALAFHSPCTLQHGLRITNVVESLLTRMGFKLTHVPDAHRCCGSAGVYSLLQKSLANRLLQKKIADLESGAPDMIVTANIGCLLHLQSGTQAPVKHWIEVLADRLVVAS